MTNLTSPTSAPVPESSAFLQYATEGGGGLGERLKFHKGQWFCGDDEIPLGTQYLAEMDQLARGWVRWHEGKPVEYRLDFVRDGKKIANREDLGFTDESEWEQDEKGKPKDPWQKQSFLPLLHLETVENFVWVFSSLGSERAAQKLSLAYWKRGLSHLPIVSLQAGSYRHDTFGRIDTPILKIERWQDRDGSAPTLAPASIPKLTQRENPISSGLPAKAKASADCADLNDEIIF